jgi:hypothetical protein
MSMSMSMSTVAGFASRPFIAGFALRPLSQPFVRLFEASMDEEE